MNQIDLYTQTVAWSAEDNVYVGYCRAFFGNGGVCHGSDPVDVLRELRGLVAGELHRYAAEGLTLPPQTAKAADPVEVVGTLAFA